MNSCLHGHIDDDIEQSMVIGERSTTVRTRALMLTPCMPLRASNQIAVAAKLKRIFNGSSSSSSSSRRARNCSRPSCGSWWLQVRERERERVERFNWGKWVTQGMGISCCTPSHPSQHSLVLCAVDEESYRSAHAKFVRWSTKKNLIALYISQSVSITLDGAKIIPTAWLDPTALNLTDRTKLIYYGLFCSMRKKITPQFGKLNFLTRSRCEV